MSADPGDSTTPSGTSEAQVHHGLTNRQTLFWVGQQLSGARPVYNIAFAYEIDGALDPGLFGRAFAATLGTTDSLRVVIDEADGVPRQRVLPELDHRPELVDLTAVADPAATLDEWLAERLSRSLPMAERLFDTALLKLAPERFVWYLNQHHIVTDGWSMAIIFRRVAEAYEHLRGGGDPRELSTGPSFLDYVDRERTQRSSREFERAEQYRLRKLASEVPPVHFYASRNAERTRDERRVVLRLDAERSRRLREVATDAQMPARLPQQALYLAFSSLLAVYLHRVSGNTELGIGLVFHNRHNDVDRDTAGLFVNLFPLHLRVEPDDTFVTMMRKSLAESFAAVRYGPHCISNPGRQRSYEVLLNYLPMSYVDFAGRPTRARWLHTGASDGNHGLSLHVHDFDDSGEISLVFDCNTGIFSASDRTRLLRDFDGLVDGFLDDPSKPLASLAPRTAGETAIPRPAAPGATEAPAGPSNEIEEGLVEIWQDLLGRSPIGVHDDFFALGGHSLLAVSMVSRLETRFGWSVPLTRIFTQPTIAELATSVRRRDDRDAAPAARADLLVPVRAEGANPPFFCVPGAGGHGFRLYGLAHQLEAGTPFFAFRPLEDATADTVERTAAAYCDALRARQPSGPYRVGGTCLGAFVAYEMARQLVADDATVSLVALLNVLGDPDYRAYRRIGGLLDRGHRLLGRTPPPHHDRLVDLLWTLRRWRRPSARAAAEKAPELRSLAVAQTRSALAYRPLPYPGRLTLFTARDTPARARRAERAEWEALAGGGVTVRLVPGDHDTALEPPQVTELARLLSEALADHEAPTS